MVPLKDRYGWEAEHADGTVLWQYEGDGTETPSTQIRVGEVIRFSVLPRIPGLLRHDVLIDHTSGERFVRRFGRGFVREQNGATKVAEYLQCVQTNRYRMWVFSTTGRVLVTQPDYEVYL